MSTDTSAGSTSERAVVGSQTDVVIAAVKSMITSGSLSRGSRLPIEKDLAAALSVSRGSLREGVRALVAMGVLETRQGDGTYVTSLEPSLLLAPMGFMIDLQAPGDSADLQAVRRILESEAAARAATRITPDDLARASSLLDGIDEEGAERPDPEVFMEADVDFHRIIAHASGNPALEAMIEALASRTLRARMWRAISDHGAIHETQLEHRAILTELRAGDADRARIRMSNHLLGVEEFMDSTVTPPPANQTD